LKTASQQIAARQHALEEIDRANFGWYHIRAIMVAGSGFFTDAYDIFSINMVSTMLGYVYYRNAAHKGKLPSSLDEALKVGTSAGAIIGQLLFGFLCDKFGRKRMYGVSLLIMIFTTLANALSGEGPATSAVGIIIFWRVLLGIGIGGDYPMAAVITSEFASTRYRGRMMAAVFSMQGFGIITAALVYYFTILSFKGQIISDCHTEWIRADVCRQGRGLPRRRACGWRPRRRGTHGCIVARHARPERR
jgi:PHS family inorganic phosphate transporter-like MFS transporter